MNKDIYKVFDLMRFPLILLVVCIHVNPLNTWGGVENTFWYSALNRSLPQFAVPTFFFMSGFLFFRNINGNWNWGLYKSKIKSRGYSLLIPYIIWNILAYSADLIYFFIKGYLIKDYSQAMEYWGTLSPNIFWNVHPIGTHSQNWLGGFAGYSAPIDLPLWYLRDLIVLVILAPAIWFLLKKTKGWILAVLFIAYISRLWLPYSGFGITGVFFFSLGAFMGMNQIDVIKSCNKISWMWIPDLALGAMAVYYKGTYTFTGQNLMPFYIIAAIVAAINLASHCVRKGWSANSFLVKSCFFIFACHEVVVKNVAKTIVEKVFNDSTVWPLQFLIVVVLIVTMCLAIYYCMNRWLPRVTKVLVGNK